MAKKITWTEAATLVRSSGIRGFLHISSNDTYKITFIHPNGTVSENNVRGELNKFIARDMFGLSQPTTQPTTENN